MLTALLVARRGWLPAGGGGRWTLPAASHRVGATVRRTKGGRMNTYVILRRGGWRSPEDLQAAAARSTKVGDEEMPDDIRWIRSYVLEEDGGGLGTVCVYEASSPE